MLAHMDSDFYAVPVMTCAEAKVFEKNFFSSQEKMTEEAAMTVAGTRIGEALLRECFAVGRKIPRLLVLAGKGHNGGDALIAAMRVFAATSCLVGIAVFAENRNTLAPLTQKFLCKLEDEIPEKKRFIVFLSNADAGVPAIVTDFAAQPHVLLDGIFGHGFRAPVSEKIRFFADLIFAARSRDSLCCSVDLPSGLNDAGSESCLFRADVTFPAGILKMPVVDSQNCAGRVVPVCIGFSGCKGAMRAVADETYFLKKVFKKRPALCDKRDFGHVLIVGGSRTMPGALLMNALGALRAGAGLVSVICPERVQAAFSARAPGAMWIPCAENPDGGLDFEAGFSGFKKILPRVSAVLCGSGTGTSPDAQKLIREIVVATPREIPLVLDADALRPETLSVLRERNAPAEKTILLPHAGEFARLGGDANSPRRFCAEYGVLMILKGACTRIVSSAEEWLTFSGTPALARGGSGDILAGMTVAMFASPKNFDETASPEERLAATALWHGNAARKLASEQSERCADISALPEFLGKVFEC